MPSHAVALLAVTRGQWIDWAVTHAITTAGVFGLVAAVGLLGRGRPARVQGLCVAAWMAASYGLAAGVGTWHCENLFQGRMIGVFSLFPALAFGVLHGYALTGYLREDPPTTPGVEGENDGWDRESPR